MANYSIAEDFTLPSLGKVYNENVTPNVKLRSMTTQEEMKRLSPSDKAYKNLCEVIDDCLVEDPGISAYDMCLADYQYLLHKLRIVTYGSDYNTTSKCPHCLTMNNNVLDLDTLSLKTYDSDDFTKLTKFVLPKTGKEITIKVQTPRMLDEVNSRTQELKNKSNNKSLDAALLFTIDALIDTIDGEKPDPVMKEKFVRNLPMMDTNYIIKHAQKLVESFGLDLKVQFKCPICGLTYDSYFRITSEFFGPTLDI